MNHRLLSLLSLILVACGTNNPSIDNTPIQTPTPNPTNIISQALPSANLPISHQHPTQWHCAPNLNIQTQYLDPQKTQLSLNYQGKTHLLSQRPSRLPAIYENSQIAFYSDGESAVIAKPLSDLVYHGGCHPIS